MDTARNKVLLFFGAMAGAALTVALLLGAMALSAGLVARPAAAQADPTVVPVAQASDTALGINDRPHIAVTGVGSVSAKPDILRLQVGVEIQQASLQAAQDEAAVKASAVISGLMASGVAEKDIATASYNVEPVTDSPENGAPNVVGFRVTQIFSVTLRDIPGAGKIIDGVVSSGANRIYGLSFDFSDPTAIVQQAREAAMSDAKAKAGQLAAAGGVALGTPLLIEENSNAPVVTRGIAAPVAQAGDTVPIIAGQQEIQVQVQVIYGIK